MAIENNGGGTLITGNDILWFNGLRVASALALEITTGMKMSSRGSAMLTANRISGSDKRTKRGALIELVAHIESTYGRPVDLPSVRKAMAKK